MITLLIVITLVAICLFIKVVNLDYEVGRKNFEIRNLEIKADSVNYLKDQVSELREVIEQSNGAQIELISELQRIKDLLSPISDENEQLISDSLMAMIDRLSEEINY